MPGQLKRYAMGGTLFALFLLGVGGFVADFLPRYDSNAMNYTFVNKTAAVTTLLNGSLKNFTDQTQNVTGTSSTGLGLPLVLLQGALDLFKMPFTMAGYLVSLVTDLFGMVGIPEPYSQLLLLLITMGAAWAFLDAAQGKDS